MASNHPSRRLQAVPTCPARRGSSQVGSGIVRDCLSTACLQFYYSLPLHFDTRRKRAHSACRTGAGASCGTLDPSSGPCEPPKAESSTRQAAARRLKRQTGRKLSGGTGEGSSAPWAGTGQGKGLV